MTRTALAALLALCVLAPALAGESTRESVEDTDEPPKKFPDSKAEPYSPGRMPTAKAPIEATDMKNNPGNETEAVHHPKVKDPGTTHAEGAEGGRGSIHACTLPRFHDGESNSSASDWLADSGNVTKVCHLNVEWLNGTSGTLRVCSIPRDAWNSSYTFDDGTIPKELLAELINATNVKCVTPSEALSNSSAVANDTITNGSIPSAWLRDSNNNIYIYIIPQEWLRGSKPVPGKASEVEDLTKDSVDVATPTPAPNATSSVPVVAVDATTQKSVVSTVAAPALFNGTTNASVGIASNVTGAGNATGTLVVSSGNSSSTKATPTSNVTEASSAVAPEGKVAKSNDTQATASPPVALPKGDATTEKHKEQTAKTTARPTEKSTRTTQKPNEETTKTTAKPTVAVVTTPMTQQSEENVAGKGKEPTAQNPKEEVKPTVHHSDTENEIVHGVASPPPPEALSQQHSNRNHATSSGKTAFLQPTESAAILAGVFVAIALLGYAGLLLWRRVLERRYGNREMLVNEDDDFDTSDMRHFEL